MPFIWCSQEQHKGNFNTEMIKLAIQTHKQTKHWFSLSFWHKYRTILDQFIIFQPLIVQLKINKFELFVLTKEWELLPTSGQKVLDT